MQLLSLIKPNFKIVPILIAILQPSFSSANSVNVVSRDDANAAYAISMIELAFSKIEDPPKLHVIHEAWTTPKMRESMKEGKIQIIWSATSSDLEKELIPVRIPLYKGLLGNRVFIVHRMRDGVFDKVHTISDLRKFRFCQGRFWSDTDIMEHNGLAVVGATKYESLFHMVDGGRCDAFPRGVHEPWDEIKRRPELDLVVEKRIMMKYLSPYYLFVSPKHPGLAEKLEKGLRVAINDGSFNNTFYNDQSVQSVIQQSNFSKRVVIELENPFLPKETPLNDERLWW
jgi:hypothetical protein